MKYLMLTALMIVAGCDTPTRSRFPSTIGTGNNQTVGTGFDLTSGGTSSGSTTGTTTGGTTATPGFESCSLAKNNTTADLGSIGVCQSAIDETKLRFVSSIGNDSSRTCLIPTYKDQYGNSTYLGQPQCTYTIAEKIYTGTLIKNRSGMGSYPINGVMIMKETLLPEYFQCMDAYMYFIQGNCPQYQSPQCAQAATNYRNGICNNFKLKYPNNYLDLNI